MVGNGHEPTSQGVDPGRTNPYFNHDSVYASNLYAVTHDKGLIHKNRDPAKDIRHKVLRSEAQSQSTNSHTCQQRRDIISGIVHGHNDTKYPNG